MFPEGYARWRDAFARALDGRFYTIEYVDTLVWSGRARLFADERAAVLVEIRIYPTGARDAHFLVGAGALEALVDLAAQVEAWGRAHGCIGTLIESRSGWSKVMKTHGYETHQVSVRKEL
jgi:hypothetical protein